MFIDVVVLLNVVKILGLVVKVLVIMNVLFLAAAVAVVAQFFSIVLFHSWCLRWLLVCW